MARGSGMDTNDIIRYAVIAAGAYFGYRWAVSQGMIGDVLGIAGDVAPYPGTALPPGQQAPGQFPGQQLDDQPQQPSDTSGGGTPGDNTAPGGTGGAVGDVKAQVWEAAKSEANQSGGMLHFWQWNYYLPADLPKVDPFQIPASQWPNGEKPLDAAQVQATPLTIDQWWAMVKGPMGLGGLYRPGGVNHWSQPSSIYYGDSGYGHGPGGGNYGGPDMGGSDMGGGF